MYIKAVSFLLIGILGISINDTIIKFLSDAYALHQLVFIRGTFALLIIVPLVLVRQGIAVPVSYTHLTLPTSDLV